MQVAKGTPGPGEGFLVTLRGRHAGDLQRWAKDRLRGATPCPDAPLGYACLDCLGWALAAALLDDEVPR